MPTTEAAPAENPVEPFTWTSPSTGTVVTIARRTAPASGTFRRIRKLDDMSAMYELLEEIATPAEVALTDPLPLAEVSELVQAWTRFVAGGVGVGESASSSS